MSGRTLMFDPKLSNVVYVFTNFSKPIISNSVGDDKFIARLVLASLVAIVVVPSA